MQLCSTVLRQLKRTYTATPFARMDNDAHAPLGATEACRKPLLLAACRLPVPGTGADSTGKGVQYAFMAGESQRPVCNPAG
jgi:hypothetical protein